ncbi:mannose-1-phosphate guanylyltransferase [Arcanobacterium phocae]|uniref:mannose-1-phosphate guanylyltransferase n=1 Tax=Arcanobacterium phocae TaxID=131112 RepID=UPI001C0EAE75|nr:mannose-1-phosphate guanylyltransferase [Arcanobacterium phocae]
MNELHAIIPAGGAGTRLWPISRARSPKFLKDLTGSGKSLLQQTVARLSPLANSNIMIVTGGAHMPAVVRQLPELADEQFIAEPSPRDSMAAIGLAAAIIRQRHGNVIVGSFAADHLIAEPEAFETAVWTAMDAATRGYVVTIGITPDSPATGFGYIRAANPVTDVRGAFDVSEFLEKPDVDTVQAYVASGQYFWNAGMFVAQADVLLGALATYQPELHAGIEAIAQAWDTGNRSQVLDHVWPSLTKIAIDHAIAEPLAADGGVAVVPAQMGWTDVGDFAAVSEVLRRRADDASSSIVIPGSGEQVQPVFTVKASRATIFTHDRPIAVIGVDDVVVVDTADAVLVVSAHGAQDVKNVVDQIRAEGVTSLL